MLVWRRTMKPKALVQQLQAMLAAADAPSRDCVVSTGCPAIDERLPEGGVRRGALVEWLSASSADGATLLALRMAREIQNEGAIIVVDRTGTLYPPAVAACRIDLGNTIFVHPADERNEAWAVDQALRCEHASAVLAWPQRLDDRTFRRWQLAAERSGALGLLVRPATSLDEPSWADVRLLIAPEIHTVQATDRLLRNWRLTLRILRCRGQAIRREEPFVVEIDQVTGDAHETNSRHLVSGPPRIAPPMVG